MLYAAITPLGIAIGLGVRTTYNPDSANAVIVAGTLDAVSAGILLYTGLVELLAHDFIFNRESEWAVWGCVLFLCTLLLSYLAILYSRAHADVVVSLRSGRRGVGSQSHGISRLRPHGRGSHGTAWSVGIDITRGHSSASRPSKKKRDSGLVIASMLVSRSSLLDLNR